MFDITPVLQLLRRDGKVDLTNTNLPKLSGANIQALGSHFQDFLVEFDLLEGTSELPGAKS